MGALGGDTEGMQNGRTFGFGWHLLFLGHLFLATTAAGAAIFLIAVRAILVIIIIGSIIVTL
jgi:hypothetical protein